MIFIIIVFDLSHNVSLEHRFLLKDNSFLAEKTINKTESVNYEVQQILQSQLEQYRSDSLLIIDEDTLITATLIYTLFSENNFEPLWTSENHLLPYADSLLKIIETSNYHGLVPDKYFSKIISDKIILFNDPLEYKINVTRIYEINILLSDAFFRFVVDLNKGRLNPKTLLPEWKIDLIDSNLVLTLQNAFLNKSFNKTIESFEPKTESYRKLKGQLQTQLANVPADSNDIKINKIMMNMERWRWESVINEDYYITINIPSYSFRLYECDTLSLVSKIIAGKPDTPTPYLLDSKITYFFVYPYWFVPFSIATKEILPILKKDTAYLNKHNMEVMNYKGDVIDSKNIKWKRYSEKFFPYTIRQRDGDENTLGVM